MARIYAKLKTAIWGDDDYRDLPMDAQWLYEYLFSSPKIDIAGVTEWHIGRIVAKSADATPERVTAAAEILLRRGYIIVDPGTEELLVRSFVRHDDALRSPKTAKGVINAWSDISSDLIRVALAYELVRIRDEHPDWSGVREVSGKVLEAASRYPQIGPGYPIGGLSDTPSDTPCHTPSDQLGGYQGEGVSEGVSQGYPILPMVKHQLPPTTLGGALSAEPPAGSAPDGAPREKRATRIPPDFHVTDDMRNWSGINTPLIDPDAESAKFVDYWTAKPGKDGTKLDWVATWRNWMRRATPARTPTSKTERDQAALARQLEIARRLDAQEAS